MSSEDERGVCVLKLLPHVPHHNQNTGKTIVPVCRQPKTGGQFVFQNVSSQGMLLQKTAYIKQQGHNWFCRFPGCSLLPNCMAQTCPLSRQKAWGPGCFSPAETRKKEWVSFLRISVLNHKAVWTTSFSLSVIQLQTRVECQRELITASHWQHSCILVGEDVTVLEGMLLPWVAVQGGAREGGSHFGNSGSLMLRDAFSSDSFSQGRCCCPDGMLGLDICRMHHLLAKFFCDWVFSRFFPFLQLFDGLKCWYS